jgi:hypothetical protein
VAGWWPPFLPGVAEKRVFHTHRAFLETLAFNLSSLASPRRRLAVAVTVMAQPL